MRLLAICALWSIFIWAFKEWVWVATFAANGTFCAGLRGLIKGLAVSAAPGFGDVGPDFEPPSFDVGVCRQLGPMFKRNKRHLAGGRNSDF